MGFAGDGDLAVPLQANESTERLFRADRNRGIRGQRMVNEHGIGYINNRYRLSLGDHLRYGPSMLHLKLRRCSQIGVLNAAIMCCKLWSGTKRSSLQLQGLMIISLLHKLCFENSRRSG